MGKYYDDLGLIVTADGDGGDSAHLVALDIQATSLNPARAKLFLIDGKVVRHPRPAIPNGWGITKVPPWDNPSNGTRDQMSGIVGCLAAHGYKKECRKLFWDTLLRLGFAQNFERDAKGTTKFPWPHYAHRQMGNPAKKYPAYQGWPQWLVKFARPILKTLRIVKQENDGAWVWFDFADPLWLAPHYILAMAAGGWPKLKPVLKVLAAPFFFLDAMTYKYSQNDDMGAILGCAYAFGWIGWFKKLVPNWEAKCIAYFNPRGFEELGKDVIAWLKKSS